MTTPYPLTDEQIRFYRDHGFVQLDDVLTQEELTALRDAADEIMGRRFDVQVERSARDPELEKVFMQKINLWRLHGGISHHTLNTRIAHIARRLAGFETVRLWHDQLLVKMPGDSKASPWHQDFPYWPMEQPGALSCWMALDDVDGDNGCMHFIPGSHQWGALEPVDFVNPQALAELAPDDVTEVSDPIMVPLKAGSCTFHNGLTFHYAGPNRTARPRRAMVTIYMAGDTRYTGAEHPITDGKGLSVGQAFEDALFPVLAGAEAD